MIETSELGITKHRKSKKRGKVQFSDQQNVPRGTLERSFGTLHVGSLLLIET